MVVAVALAVAMPMVVWLLMVWGTNCEYCTLKLLDQYPCEHHSAVTATRCIRIAIGSRLSVNTGVSVN